MSKKSKPKIKINRPTPFLTICKDCRIRLVVPEDKAKKCDLCDSPNVSAEPWRQ